ncbi:MAG: hypothetical protein ACI8WB_004810 [Phenylobacterium sp.]|jgi:hypothetical protein
MNNVAAALNNKPWYQHKMVWLVIGLPLTSVIVGIAFVITAVRGGDDVVKDNYYKEGKAINRQFEEDEQAQQQAISAVVNFDPQTQKMRMTLMSVSPPFIRFSLFHTAKQAYDLSGALAKVSDAVDGKGGIYQYQFTQEQATRLNGQWYLEIKGDDGQGNNIWRLRARVILPTNQAIVLSPIKSPVAS